MEEEVTSFRARAFIVLGRLAKHDAAYLEYLIGQPWFQDGLSLDDVALIVAARGGCGNVIQFEELVGDDPQVRSQVLSLPAGEVKLFAI